jgi:hypothetical protein
MEFVSEKNSVDQETYYERILTEKLKLYSKQYWYSIIGGYQGGLERLRPLQIF